MNNKIFKIKSTSPRAYKAKWTPPILLLSTRLALPPFPLLPSKGPHTLQPCVLSRRDSWELIRKQDDLCSSRRLWPKGLWSPERAAGKNTSVKTGPFFSVNLYYLFIGRVILCIDISLRETIGISARFPSLTCFCKGFYKGL